MSPQHIERLIDAGNSRVHEATVESSQGVFSVFKNRFTRAAYSCVPYDNKLCLIFWLRSLTKFGGRLRNGRWSTWAKADDSVRYLHPQWAIFWPYIKRYSSASVALTNNRSPNTTTLISLHTQYTGQSLRKWLFTDLPKLKDRRGENVLSDGSACAQLACIQLSRS